MSLDDFLKSPESMLHKLIFLMDNHANQLMETKFGLSLNHFKFLMTLYQNPDFNQKELSSCMHITESGISKTITHLKELGYLKATINPKNRREHILELTNTGQTLIKQAFVTFRNETKDLFACLMTQEANIFNQSLQKLISQF